jgi:hypothetical protein
MLWLLLACPLCAQMAQPIDHNSPPAVLDMVLVTKDLVSGAETPRRAEDLDAKFEAPHGFSCSLDRSVRMTQAGSGDSPYVYAVSCVKGGEKSSLEHACSKNPSEQRLEGHAANGMAVMAVTLRCAPTT